MSALISTATDCVLRAATRAAVTGRALDPEQAEDVAKALLSDDAEEVDVAPLLAALATRGASAHEVAALVRAVLTAAVAVSWDGTDTADLVGTGGDGSGSVNLSTFAALVAAAAGVTTAKAGNRAATSRCGSADVLEQLGVPVDPGPVGLARLLAAHRFAFVHTPALHPAVGRWAPLRRRLGFRTVFNLTGPLSNPVARGARLIGSADARDQEVLAEAAWLLGHRRTWVVRGDDGLDEVSSATTTRVLSVGPDGVRGDRIDPTALGVRPPMGDDLAGGDAVHNAAVARTLLDDAASPGLRDAVALNAAVLLHLAGRTTDLPDGVRAARAAIADGRARRLVDAVRSFNGGTDNAS